MLKMKNLIRRTLIILLIVSALMTLLLLDINGSFATTFIIKSYRPAIVSDERGGAFMAIYDLEEEKTFTQHLDSSGNFTWESSGAVTPASSAENLMIYDGKDGVILVWDGEIQGIQGLYAQRLDSSGNTVWNDNGVLVHKRIGGESPGWLSDSAVVPDNGGGAIIIWKRLEGSCPIYAQKIDSYGNTIWDTSGIQVAQNSDRYKEIDCISDGMGRAIIIWSEITYTEYKTAEYKVIAQRLDEAGNILWGRSGKLIGSDYYDYKIISDGNCGAVVVFCNYQQDITFLNLDNAGKIVWGEENNTGFTTVGHVYSLEILPNGSGGMFLVWAEEYTGRNIFRDDTNIYAQQIDSLGNPVWEKGSVAICTAVGDQNYPKLVTDISGGFITTWQDFRDDSRYLFTQRVDVSGNTLWVKNGVNLGRYYYPFRDFEMFSNGLGGAVIIREEGESLEPRIFSQVVDRNGDSIEPETSLFPACLPRIKQDYEAVIGSTTVFYSPEKSIWIWLIPLSIFVILFVLFVIIKSRRNQKISKIQN